MFCSLTSFLFAKPDSLVLRKKNELKFQYFNTNENSLQMTFSSWVVTTYTLILFFDYNLFFIKLIFKYQDLIVLLKETKLIEYGYSNLDCQQEFASTAILLMGSLYIYIVSFFDCFFCQSYCSVLGLNVLPKKAKLIDYKYSKLDYQQKIASNNSFNMGNL